MGIVVYRLFKFSIFSGEPFAFSSSLICCLIIGRSSIILFNFGSTMIRRAYASIFVIIFVAVQNTVNSSSFIAQYFIHPINKGRTCTVGRFCISVYNFRYVFGFSYTCAKDVAKLNKFLIFGRKFAVYRIDPITLLFTDIRPCISQNKKIIFDILIDRL